MSLCKIVPLKKPKAAGIFAVEFAAALVGEPNFTEESKIKECAEIAKKNAAAVFETSKEANPSSLKDVYPETVRQITAGALDVDFMAGQLALNSVAAKIGGVILNEPEGFAAAFAGTGDEFVLFNPKTGHISKSSGDFQQDLGALLNGLKPPFQLYLLLPPPIKKEPENENHEAKKRLDVSASIAQPSEEEPTIEKEKDPAPKKRAYRKRPAPSSTTTSEPVEKAPKVVAQLVVAPEETTTPAAETVTVKE